MNADGPAPDAPATPEEAVDRANAIFARYPFVTFRLVEVSHDLLVGLNLGDTGLGYDGVLVFKEAQVVQVSRHWFVDETAEPVLVLAEGDEERRVLEAYGVSDREGYRVFRIRGFAPGPYCVVAKHLEI